MSECTRPIVRWHGGKWKIAPWIISHFPSHKIYVEPFGGGGSILLRKPRVYSEIYNDLDGEIVNLFRVARDHGPELVRAIELTPFSRQEFELAYEKTDDLIERARRLVTRTFMGFGTNAHHRKTGFRSKSHRNNTTAENDWRNYPESLVKIISRLRGVVIENKNALDLMSSMDGDEILFYLDPPYLPETRDAGSDYGFEMTRDDHVDMLITISKLSGMVILSGYDNAMYDEYLPNWRKSFKDTFADGAKKRTEVLWISPNCDSRRLF